MKEHTKLVHTDCSIPHCAICDGGLFVCTVCGGAEGTLTTDCCGGKIGPNLADMIYAGQIDYKDGKWVDL